MTREEVVERLERWSDSAKMHVKEFEETFPNHRSSWREDVEMFDMAISALREQGATDNNVGNKWISVKERLPQENQRVILYIPRVAEGGNVRTGWLEPIKMWFTDSRDRLFYKQITHWMPLPEPPKEDTPC